MAKTIRVDADTHEALAALKGADESFDDVISRLLEDRHDLIREGAGLWEGTDAADRARGAREELKEDIGAR